MKKKWLALLTAVMLVFCQPGGVSAAEVVADGSRGTLVQQIQLSLNGLSYSCGSADGICGTRTVGAIKAFQSAAHQNGLTAVSRLKVDGIAGSATQSALFSIVRALQRGLNQLGYNAGSADGVYGTVAAAAVRRFQQTYGLSVDGIAGPKTRAALAGALSGTSQVTTSSSLAEFQAYALQSWARPVTARILPVQSGRQFGAVRSDGRLHAGIDWYVENGAGTPVYAMADGTVEEYLYDSFYGGTGMLSVRHDDGSVARYGEVTPLVKSGVRVRKGQQIAVLKANSYDGGTMLHLELYRGTASGSLTVSGNRSYTFLSSGNYQRRRDLLDPTFLLGL
ncbi:MAG: peptidoglycan-binding protein [Oscillospiraceae bacterium]|nr:peptidoglycan-binding protein [Oscillospiraceae bacterium]